MKKILYFSSLLFLAIFCFALQANAGTTPSVALTASTNSAAAGSTVLFSWTKTGDFTACSASGAWTGVKAIPTSQIPTVSENVAMPSAAGSYTFTLTCVGATGPGVSSSVVINVTAQPSLQVSVSASPNPSTVGQQVTWTINASGGSGNYAYTSNNISVSSSLTYTYSSPGTYTVTVTAKDTSTGATKSASGSITVNSVPPPPPPPPATTHNECVSSKCVSINKPGTSSCQNDSDCSDLIALTLNFSTSTGKKSISVLQGEPFILIWSTTGADHCKAYRTPDNKSRPWEVKTGSAGVSGLMDTAGPANYATYVYVLTCYNSRETKSVTGKVTVEVKERPIITLKNPSGGKQWKAGGTYEIIWDYTGIPDPSTSYASIVLKKIDAPEKTQPITITSSVQMTKKSYIWDIPVNTIVGDYYQIEFKAKDNKGNDIISRVGDIFSIVANFTPPPPALNNCCLCAYQYPQGCEIDIDSAGRQKCSTFEDKATCNSEREMGCRWRSDTEIYGHKCEFDPSLACLFNPSQNTADCKFDSSDPNNLKCISRFKNDCLNKQKIALADGSCSNFQIVGVERFPAFEKIEDFLNNTKCDNFSYFQSGHGSEFDCPYLGDVMNACVSCTGGNCGINVVSNACSQFQNKNEVKTLALNIQKKLCSLKSSATATITANQAVASKNCNTPETITITCKNISTTFLKCSDLPKQCFENYETTKCSNYDKSGVYKGDSEYLCCPDYSVNYSTIGGGFPLRWVLPTIYPGGVRACPLNDIKLDEITSSGASAKEAANNLHNAVLTAQTKCASSKSSAQLFVGGPTTSPDYGTDPDHKIENFIFSLNSACINAKSASSSMNIMEKFLASISQATTWLAEKLRIK